MEASCAWHWKIGDGEEANDLVVAIEDLLEYHLILERKMHSLQMTKVDEMKRLRYK